MQINGGLYIVKSTNGAPIASFDGVSGNVSITNELYKPNASRLSCTCNTITYNIPTNTPTTVPFNLALSKTGSKITLDASGNGKINLLDIGMYEVFFYFDILQYNNC